MNFVNFLKPYIFRPFDCLPEVRKCGVWSLKFGCGAIATWHLWTSSMMVVMALFSQDFFTMDSYDWLWFGNKYQCVLHKKYENTVCPQNIFMDPSFKLFLLVVEVAIIFGCIALIIGIYMERSRYISMFLYVYCVIRIIDIVLIVVFLSLGIYSSCKAKHLVRFNCLASLTITVTTSMCVIIIINSYRSFMKKMAVVSADVWGVD